MTLSVVGATKRYHSRTVVDAVDLEVRPGQIVGLLGPSGAGKSTLFKMLVGEISPDGGAFTVDGTDISQHPIESRVRAGVGYVAQSAQLFGALTVEKNLMLALQVVGYPQSEHRQRLANLVDEFQLTNLMDAPFRSLSGGQKRLVALAVAATAEPKYVLLDEPFAQLDPIIAEVICQIVQRWAARGCGVVLSSHKLDIAFSILDEAYILRDGKVVAQATTTEIAHSRHLRELLAGIGQADWQFGFVNIDQDEGAKPESVSE